MPLPRGPAYYTCQNQIQLTGNINVQHVIDLANSQRSSLADTLSSQSTSPVSPLLLSLCNSHLLYH